MRDKRPAIAAKHKSGFPPHKGGLQAEGRFDFVFLEVTTYGWLRESYNPVKNAMCKRWDTPEIFLSVAASDLPGVPAARLPRPVWSWDQEPGAGVLLWGTDERAEGGRAVAECGRPDL